jgi:chemotaxis protein methyltransferase CheR
MTVPLFERSLEARAGIRMDRAMRERLDDHVRRVARERGISVAGYADLLDRDEAERQVLIDRLVVPTTSFFRHPEQFDALRELLRAIPGPVTVWSAGCSTGQEPYSLAMLLRESGRRDWRVVATDLSTAALARAAEGVYEERELEGLSQERRRRHLERAGGRWRVAAEPRARVTWLHHNLVAEDVPAAARAASVVFCRNVLIYLRPEALRAVLGRFAEQLPRLDALFVGATESLWGATDRLTPVPVGTAYAYRPAGRRLPAPPVLASAPMPLPVPVPAPGPEAGAAACLAGGEAALAAGDGPVAVVAFRKACYLDGDDPLAHIGLALALEAAGQEGARRAYAAAQAALDRRGTGPVAASLEGFSAAELAKLIRRQLARSPLPP